MTTNPEIKFVSYSGEYPNLCSGTLVVEVDGKKVEFRGYSRDDKNSCFPEFWASGGCVSFDDNWEESVTQGEWELSIDDEKDYPHEILSILPDILSVMNENVPYGCCGGCV